MKKPINCATEAVITVFVGWGDLQQHHISAQLARSKVRAQLRQLLRHHARPAACHLVPHCTQSAVGGNMQRRADFLGPYRIQRVTAKNVEQPNLRRNRDQLRYETCRLRTRLADNHMVARPQMLRQHRRRHGDSDGVSVGSFGRGHKPC